MSTPPPGPPLSGLAPGAFDASGALDRLSDPFFAVDRSWRTVFVNRRAEQMMQVQPGGLTGRLLWDLEPGLQESELGLAYQRSMATQEAERVEVYYPPFGRWYVIQTHPAPNFLGVTLHDVTERKRNERRADLLQHCALAIGAAPDLRGGLVLALADIREALGTEYGELWMSIEDGSQLEAVVTEHSGTPTMQGFAARSRGFRLAAGEGLPGAAWTRRETVVVPDLLQEVGFKRSASAREAGLISAVMVPVLSGDRPIGVFGFLSTRPLEQGDVAALVSGLPAALGQVVEQQRRNAEVDRIFSLSVDLLCIASLDGWFLRLNPAWERLLGYSEQELTSRPYREFVHPDDRDATGQRTAQLKGGASVAQFENRYRTRDGRWKWLSWSALAVPEERLVYAVARDVTERHRRDEQEALRQGYFAAMATGAPLTAVMRKLVELAELEVEGARASVLELDPEGRLRTVAAPHLPSAYNAQVDGLLPGPTAGTCGAAVATGGLMVSADIATDPLWALYREIAAAHRLAACWSLPIRASGGAILGTVALYFDRPRVPEMAELGVLERAAGLAGIALERHRSTEELLLLHQAVSRLNDAIIITEAAPLQAPGPRIRFVNEAFERLTGWLRDEVLGRHPRVLQGEATDRAALDRIRAALEAKRTVREELLNYTRDGRPFWVEVDIAPVVGADGTVTHFVAVQRDTTERHRIAEQMIQTQKMEAVGRLAGGVAHDFNNMLTAILGFSDLILDRESDFSHREELEQIRLAAQRAAGLTRQLLAFSRRQVLHPVTLDVNATIRNLEEILRRVMGEDVVFTTTLAPDLPAVVTDPNQFEQALVNLTVNARDAMPEGGQLVVETSVAEVDAAEAAAHPGATAGRHVMITVRDTGQGMDREVLARAFEPFFTTKPQGRGTGLGLSTVYGIVAQAGGHVRAASRPGEGTTITLCLPAATTGVDTITETDQGPVAAAAGETVLVAEDEELVRHLAVRFLERLGYRVLSAAAGDEALALVQGHHGAIDLLMTDVVMPRMTGKQLADHLTALRPGIKVLFVSGYAEDSIVHHGVLEEGINFLEKPFTYDGLARKVREVLDTP
jgi:PAS domain S-box-containing protein